ncbi:serine/threonine protein kinase, partial [Leptolyngbya sp. FACHB-36]|nr:serine/threonine protein kinase [Leptolyngbya sp. FACHB-36]
MTTSAPDDSLTQLLGDRYRLERSLGCKAGRQTWLAQDVQTQEHVVLKQLTFSRDLTWDDVTLLEREAETLQSLSHAAIPRYLEQFELSSTHSKRIVLVQTYLDAPSL